MRKLLWLLLCMAVLGAACSPQAATVPTAAPEAQVSGAPTVVVATEFTPTDPTTVNLAAGRPQLVEFYAVW